MTDAVFPFALVSSFDSQEFEKILTSANEVSMNIPDNMLQGNIIKQEMNQFNPQQLLMQQLQHDQQHQLLVQPQHQQQQQPEWPHQSRIPNLAPVTSAYDFEVSVPPDPNVVYHAPKLYIKMSSKMTINVAYRPQNHINEPLNVRAMIIFSSPSEMHLPVKRCANHRVANTDGLQIPKDASILKMNDPKATYHGSENGEIFSERLSVLVPLESGEFDNLGRRTQMIGLEFGCLNSCVSGINRRPTSIVFTLENGGGELIGKSAIEFKVCSCPKRDSERDQREKTKRKAEGSFPRGKHPRLQRPQPVKTEPEESESDSANQNLNNEQNVAAGFATTVVSLTMPTDMVPELLKFSYNLVAGKMAEDSKRSTNYDGLEKCLKDLKKLRKDVAKKST